MAETNTSNIGFEKQIWDAACVLRGNIDASEYKSVVLGLIFLKYISDRFEAKYQELVAEGDGFEEDKDEYTAENIFFVPENARWSVISAAAHTPEIGTVIDEAMRSIEKENKRLKDILPKNFARPELDKRRLGEVVDLFTNIQMIDHGNSKDILGRTYEYCLAKFAEQEGKLAGEFYTPSCVVRTLVEVLQPYNGRVYDPCCGSGGFLLAAQSYLSDPKHYTLDREAKEFLKRDTFRGWEIVPTTFKMSLMNLFLHNIGDLYGEVPITLGDALLTDPGERFDYVLTNPPFGKKSSLTFTNEEGEQEEEDLVYNRQDFWTTSSNKQLNFLQHINTLLKATGKAAVVVPDNVLFEGGAGETIRKKLLETCDLHTILRLPTGIFYKPGVKANVIFFDKRPASPERQTKEVWFYDLRTNLHFTLKQHPMTYEDLKDFIQCYHPENRYERHETWSQDNPDGRWRRFTAEEILNRDKTSLDIFWIKDKALADLDNLPAPEELAEDILENLQSAMDGFSELLDALKQ